MTSRPIHKRPSTWWGVVASAIGFVSGLFLRGPISGGADWCRDVDYGTLPQWLTLLLGIFAGVLTYMGVRTAQRSLETSQVSYTTDVRNREFAQARLVYGELVANERLAKGTGKRIATQTRADVVQFLSNAQDRSKTDSNGILVAPRFPASANPSQSGMGTYFGADEDCRVYLIRVHNDSDELISEVTATLRERANGSGGSIGGVLIPPRSVVERFIVLPEDDAFDVKAVDIKFRDATGLWWSREGPSPVVRIEGPGG